MKYTKTNSLKDLKEILKDKLTDEKPRIYNAPYSIKKSKIYCGGGFYSINGRKPVEIK